MSAIPPMVPSAEERVDIALNEWEQEIGLAPAVDEAIQRAYRDGALAERQRLLVMLREPSDEILRVFLDAYHRGLGSKPATRTLVAIAAKLAAPIAARPDPHGEPYRDAVP